jgi:hypothetical protein
MWANKSSLPDILQGLVAGKDVLAVLDETGLIIIKRASGFIGQSQIFVLSE